MHRQTMNYSLLGGLIGVEPRSVGTVLDVIHEYCEVKGYPILNVIVVSKQTGKPGRGYPGLSDLHLETERVFQFDWLRVGPVSAEDLAS